MVTYLPRSAWTSTAASGDTLTGTKLRGVAVHWPGTQTSQFGVESSTDVGQRLRHYRAFHVNTNGWRDIGYNLAIDQAGRVWRCRTNLTHGDLVGAHCASPSNPDANQEYVGVLFLLGREEHASRAMIDAFQHWRHNRFLVSWPGREDLREHSEVPGAETLCAGPYVSALLRSGALHQPPTLEDQMTPAQMAELKAHINEATDPKRILEVSLHPDTDEPRMSQYGWDHGSAGATNTPNPRLAKLIGYIWGNTRDTLIELAALRELLGTILENDPSHPLTREDLDEAIEAGMRKVRLEIDLVDDEDDPTL